MYKYLQKVFEWRSTVFISGVVLGGVCVALLIYATSLKWLTPFEPIMKDVDPAVFSQEYQLHPDKYLFLDVRSKSDYEKAHAAGSVSEPIANLLYDYLVLPRRGKEIVLICSSGRLAGVAYGFLERQGFLNLLRIEGGLNAWKDANLPVEGDPTQVPMQD